MQITLFCRSAHVFPSWRTCNVAGAGGKRRKEWIKVLNRACFAADHQTITAFKAFGAATRTDVHVVNALGAEFFRTPNVIDVIRIAAIDDDVPGVEVSRKIGDCLINGRGRDHEPHDSWRHQLVYKVEK